MPPYTALVFNYGFLSLKDESYTQVIVSSTIFKFLLDKFITFLMVDKNGNLCSYVDYEERSYIDSPHKVIIWEWPDFKLTGIFYLNSKDSIQALSVV